MTTLQINLSEPLQRFVAGRVAELGLDRADQYFEQLLEEERKKRLDEYYMEKIREGLASGPGILITPENSEAYWNGIADRVEQRLLERKRKESP